MAEPGPPLNPGDLVWSRFNKKYAVGSAFLLRHPAPPAFGAHFAGVLPLTPAWRAQVVAGRGGP